MAQHQTILFFDGVCNLCNSTIDYVIRKDHTETIMFAPLQSETTSRLLVDHDINPNDLESIIVLKDGQAYTKSDAAILIMDILGGWLKIPALIGKLTPRPIADAIYGFITRNRYRWFGKKETCRIPTAEEASRFLD